jgi:hypothetical protein
VSYIYVDIFKFYINIIVSLNNTILTCSSILLSETIFVLIGTFCINTITFIFEGLLYYIILSLIAYTAALFKYFIIWNDLCSCRHFVINAIIYIFERQFHIVLIHYIM